MVSDTLTASDLVSGSAVVDISTETNLTAGDHITLTDDDIDIDDDFVFNTTDTMSGGLSVGSVTTTDTFYTGGFLQFTTAGDNPIYFANSTAKSITWDDSPGEFDFSHGITTPSASTTDDLSVGDTIHISGTATSTNAGNQVISGSASTTNMYLDGLLRFGNDMCIGEDTGTTTPNITTQNCTDF